MTTQQALVGWCGPIERAADMQRAGLDYIEVQLVPLKLEDGAAFANAKAAVRSLPLPALAMSYLFPHDFRLVAAAGEVVDERRIRHYFDRVVELLVLAGSQVVVLGSGWTRNVPDGGSREQTQAQFLTALGWCADALQGSGTTLVIESLNRKESNFINSVNEGVQLAKLLNRAEVRGLADFYHMDEENEPLDTLLHNAGWVKHIHLADTGRLNPGTGNYPYPAFMQQLQASGYSGMLSCECGVQGEPVAAMQRSAAFLRSFTSSRS